MNTIITAAEALRRYQSALETDCLIQNEWHREDDGRHLACALGVIGDDVKAPKDCPAQIMPRWLAQMVPWLFDSQDFDDAKAWGLKFYAELARLNGKVPFSVLYDWRGNVGMPLRIEAAEKRGKSSESHIALQDLFRRALTGDRAARDVWLQALKKSYAYADAYAYAYADAYAFKNKKKEAIKRLANGLIECLQRVPTPE